MSPPLCIWNTMALHWLFKFFKHTILKRPDVAKPVIDSVAKKQTSLFLNLPLDILHVINDELSLSARILLSQTCKDLRYQLRDDCCSTLRNASPEERLKILCDLGIILLDYQLCINCCALHPVDAKDLPIVSFYRICLAERTGESRYRLNSAYIICFHHVQLAIKYTGLEETYQRMRASILQSFQTFLPQDHSSIKVEFFAKPFVVRKRFLLLTNYIFYSPLEPLTHISISQTFVHFCPHLYFNTLVGVREKPVAKAIRYAMITDEISFPRMRKFSCKYCPTDCVVWVWDNRIVIRVWQDLGTGASPEDPHWRSHTRGPYDDVPVFDYEHGSIRKTYFADIFDCLENFPTQSKNENNRGCTYQ